MITRRQLLGSVAAAALIGAAPQIPVRRVYWYGHMVVSTRRLDDVLQNA